MYSDQVSTKTCKYIPSCNLCCCCS